MSMPELSGKVQTVLGPIDATALGVTLTHEHLFVDLGCYIRQPAAASERAFVHAPVTLQNRAHVDKVRYNVDNSRLWDEEAAIEEVMRYKVAGGDSLVEATSIGIGRDPLGLARISRATGLNVIMGGSYYVPISHPPDMDERSEDQIARKIVRDITVGVDETGIRSGIIGEVGCWWPLGDNERKVLRASAVAQMETGAPILIHPGLHEDSHPEIIEVLVSAGADPKRVIMGHLDLTTPDLGKLKSLAEFGCYLEYDMFGRESTLRGTTPYPSASVTRLDDDQRMNRIQFLIDEGYLGQVLVAHDVAEKIQYTRYGGLGYAHFLENIVPRMRQRGFTQDHIQAILVDNPKRALAFA